MTERVPLIFHAGAHKTGTTTLQDVLYEHRHKLREQGLFYPDPRPLLGTAVRAHHGLAHGVAEGGHALVKAREFVSDVLEEVRPGETVLLSTEVPFRRLATGEGTWWERHEAYLEHLGAELTAFDTRVVLVFRRPDRFLESVYQERVATGYSGTFAEFLRSSGSRWVNYQRQIDQFQRHIGPVQTGQYEEILSPDLVTGIMKLIGYDSPAGEAAAWKRRSADARLTMWLANRNAEDPSDEGLRLRLKFTKQPEVAELFEDFGRVTLWVDDEQRRTFLDEESAAQLKDSRLPAVLSEDAEARISASFNAFIGNRQEASMQRRAKLEAKAAKLASRKQAQAVAGKPARPAPLWRRLAARVRGRN